MVALKLLQGYFYAGISEDKCFRFGGAKRRERKGHPPSSPHRPCDNTPRVFPPLLRQRTEQTNDAAGSQKVSKDDVAREEGEEGISHQLAAKVHLVAQEIRREEEGGGRQEGSRGMKKSSVPSALETACLPARLTKRPPTSYLIDASLLYHQNREEGN